MSHLDYALNTKIDEHIEKIVKREIKDLKKEIENTIKKLYKENK